MRIVGLNSGTSFDGIDAGAADIWKNDDGTLFIKPLGYSMIEYAPRVRSAIRSVLPPQTTDVGEVAKLHNWIGQAFAEAASAVIAEYCDGTADLIVSHGQTVFHWIDDEGKCRGDLQLGEPAWIAERCRAPVVSNLRSRDIAAGGQGAPLVSIFDQLLLADATCTCAALNIGGIANLSIVSPDSPPLAFDTGPGNALIDVAMEYFTGGEKRYDKDGRWARQGSVHPGLLTYLLRDDYYAAAFPKSTGKELFNLPYLLHALEVVGDIAAHDVVATLTALTAATIANDCHRLAVRKVIASGGGIRNPALMAELDNRLGGIELCLSDAMAIDPDAKEALAFAVIGFMTVHGLPANLPSCTGAAHPAVLGDLTPGPAGLTLPDRIAKVSRLEVVAR